MAEVIQLKRVEIGKRYKFPQLSTIDVQVINTIECWIEFYEKEFVWYCEYVALWKDDEDPETKVVRDIEKRHCWKYVIERESIQAIEFVYANDSQLWFVKVYSRGAETVVQLAFNTKEKAVLMYNYFCQYKGFEHY